MLADLVSSGLGVQGMSWQTSPAATEVEDVVMEWLRQMVGLPDTFTGVIEDTASTSTFTALLCARERTSEFSQNRGGLQAEDAPLVVYASDQAHSSIPKAALLAGFGAEHLRLIETDDEHALRLDLLERAVEDDLAAGRRPCAVVAAVGTTATTALDPVAGIADLCERHGLWLHVDAALAGTAMICPEYRWMWEGVERADSVVFNPHKWMGTGFDLSAYYVRDPRAPGARDEHGPELPAHGAGRPGAQPARLGHPARSPLPRAQAVVPAALVRRRGPAGARPPRHRQRRVAGGAGRGGAGVGAHGAGAAADRVPAPRAAGAGRRRGGARRAQRGASSSA